MTVHITESVWLNASDICSLDHLVQVSGLSNEALLNLVEAGILEPANKDPDNYFFSVDCIVIARKARRLRDDFELDAEGLAVAINLLRRIDRLETQLQALQARLSQGS